MQLHLTKGILRADDAFQGELFSEREVISRQENPEP